MRPFATSRIIPYPRVALIKLKAHTQARSHDRGEDRWRTMPPIAQANRHTRGHDLLTPLKTVTGVMTCDGGMVRDHAWVGVLRMAPALQLPLFGPRPNHSLGCDGLCPGFGDWRGYEQLTRERNESATASVNYGCWFFLAGNASGWSNAYVNVGRSLRMDSRCDTHGFLYGSRKSANALCTHSPGDKYWCEIARARGYDSIQIRRGSAINMGMSRRKPWSELIVCTEQCATQRFSESACVPVARAITAAGHVRPCDCPAGAQLLSCDGKERPLPRIDNKSADARRALPASIPGERGRVVERCKGELANLSATSTMVHVRQRE